MHPSVVTWIHLVAAISLIGGLLYMQLILKPSLRTISSPAVATDLLRTVGQRFRTMTWLSLILLITTGAFTMLSEGGSARIETEWGVILMLKLVLFFVALGLILIHDFILDPYASRTAVSSQPDVAALLQRRANLVQIATIMLTLIILFVAAYLATM